MINLLLCYILLALHHIIFEQILYFLPKCAALLLLPCCFRFDHEARNSLAFIRKTYHAKGMILYPILGPGGADDAFSKQYFQILMQYVLNTLRTGRTILVNTKI